MIMNMNITEVEYEKKIIKHVHKDTIIIKFNKFSDIIIVNTHVPNLTKSKYKMEEVIPRQMANKFAVIDNIAFKFRSKQNLNTRIWANSSGFDLRVKAKHNFADWKHVKPTILPYNMALADVGNMSDEMEAEINKIENDRTKEYIKEEALIEDNKVKRMKENELIKENIQITQEKE